MKSAGPVAAIDGMADTNTDSEQIFLTCPCCLASATFEDWWLAEQLMPAGCCPCGQTLSKGMGFLCLYNPPIPYCLCFP